MTWVIWVVTGFLFACGLAMVVMRRQLLAMLLGLELMISAVNISLVYYSGAFSDAATMAGVLLIIAVAAAEAVVGLSLILGLYQAAGSTDTDSLQELRG